MRITKYIRSCLLVEKALDKILFDPGKFSFVEGRVNPAQFHDLSAIVLTHQHPDHMDDEALRKIVDHNPAAVVLANKEIQTRLNHAAIACKVFETGSCTINSFERLCTKSLDRALLCATCVSSVSLWCGFYSEFINHRDTENTEVALRNPRTKIFCAKPLRANKSLRSRERERGEYSKSIDRWLLRG